MLTAEQVALYLSRIHCTNFTEVSLENLNTLHESHLMNLSFGSVSIQDKQYISQDPLQFFDKIIINH